MRFKRILLCFYLLSAVTLASKDYVNATEILTKNGKVYLKKNLKLFTGATGYKKNREFYEDGTPSGKWISYHSNGKVKAIENWKDGQLNGKYILYNEEGIKVFETRYEKGKDHGKMTIFYETGIPRIIGSYKKGRAVGEWSYFDEDGDIKTKVKVN